MLQGVAGVAQRCTVARNGNGPGQGPAAAILCGGAGVAAGSIAWKIIVYLYVSKRTTMGTPAITLRDAAEADLPQILEIYNDVILTTTAVYSEQPHTAQMRAAWFRERKEADFPVMVAVQEGVVAGFASYGHFRVWPCYRFTVEHSVYVHRDRRGQGISKLLLQAIIFHAKNAGMHALIAGIDSSNDISLHLHSKFGFAEVARFKEVGFKFNRWLDLVFMELIIS